MNLIEHEGVMLSQSYYKCSYVTSRPTGFTNLAVSAAFLASGGPPIANQISLGAQGKSAAAMLAELDN